MRQIYHSALLKEVLAGPGTEGADGLPWQLLAWDRGELLASPGQETRYIQLLVRGSVTIYSLREDGSRQAVSGGIDDGLLLGDLEFISGQKPAYFTEARSRVLTAALPMEYCRERLGQDPAFLWMLLRSLASKLSIWSDRESAGLSLPERFLRYLAEAPDGTITQVERTAFHLHCSRRQLQRVLKDLTAEGQVEKTGKGHYKLVKTEKDCAN